MTRSFTVDLLTGMDPDTSRRGPDEWARRISARDISAGVAPTP